MEWLGRARIDFTHSSTPKMVTEKDGKVTNLLNICKKITPPCRLNPLLFSGHLQTLCTATNLNGPKVYYRRKVFQSNHPIYQGTFAVDFVAEPFKDTDDSLPERTVHFTSKQFENIGAKDSNPMLVVLHGLSGGSHEAYLRHVIAPLVQRSSWKICVINSRGCARSKVTSGVLYNARATWDIRQTVQWLRETFPNRPLFALGFSLGANILTNYCGEEGSNCLLKGAIVCSNPFNLEICSKILQRSLIGKELYLRVMGSAMKELTITHMKELERHTGLDPLAVKQITYLNEFDRDVQCLTWGYPTEYAYYRDASSSDAVLSVRIPFVAIQATDDPIAVKEAIPYAEFRQNDNTVLITTSLGGHLSWHETGGTRWYVRAVCNFLNYMAFNVNTDSLQQLEDLRLSTERPSRGTNFDPMHRKLSIDVQNEGIISPKENVLIADQLSQRLTRQIYPTTYMQPSVRSKL